MKLFCITYAGGTANFFHILSSYFDTVECIAIDYAGHGKRRAEKLNGTFDEMVRDIAGKINAVLDDLEEYILFGYSMGSIVAYEMEAQGLLKKSPNAIVVAAHYAPSISSIRVKYSELDDVNLLQCLADFGGLDDRIINNKRFWPLYLAPVRNDYRLLEAYNFDSPKKKIVINLSVLYSEKDTPFQFVKAWESITTRNVEFREYEGNHFFLKENVKEIAEYIERKVIIS